MNSKTSFSFLVLSLLTVLSISCTSDENDIVFSLEGKLNSAASESILLSQASGLNANEFNVVDTLSVNPDSTFSASYSLEPHFYRLTVHDSLNIPFVADSGQHIAIRFKSEGEYEVSGSPDTELFEEYETYRTNVLEETVYPIRSRLNEILEENDPEDTEKREALGDRVLKAEASYRDTLIHKVRDMGTSIAIYPTMVRWNGDEDLEFYQNLAADFTQEHAGLEVAELVAEKVRILEQVSIGGKVAEITAPTPSGEERSLYNNLGEFTLIDFYGSWCGPCRSESSHLVRMYEQYNDEGFEIFGFGIEYEKERWTRAIEEDNRTWINVSTVDGYTNEVARDYSITALPKNFLVDEKGIIISKDIHGQELEEKLAELFADN